MLRASCVLLEPFWFRITRRILPIPPAPAVFDQRVVNVGAIAQEHIGKGTLVLVLAVWGAIGPFRMMKTSA